jgi:hypothetical protein
LKEENEMSGKCRQGKMWSTYKVFVGKLEEKRALETIGTD